MTFMDLTILLPIRYYITYLIYIRHQELESSSRKNVKEHLLCSRMDHLLCRLVQ